MKKGFFNAKSTFPTKTTQPPKQSWNSQDVAEVVELAVEIWNTVREYYPTWRSFSHSQQQYKKPTENKTNNTVKFTKKPTVAKKTTTARKPTKTTAKPTKTTKSNKNSYRFTKYDRRAA